MIVTRFCRNGKLDSADLHKITMDNKNINRIIKGVEERINFTNTR